MNKIKDWFIKLIINKYLGGWVASLFAKLKGYKTQVGIVLIVIITGCKHFGIIPPEFIPVADQILAIIYGATGISAGDKLRRYWESAKATGDEIVNKPVTTP